MKNANAGLIVALLIGLVACSFVANTVYDKKIAMEPYEATAPTAFYAGMDKFLSNVSWMTLVQWEGEATTPHDEQRLQSLYRKLDSLTNLDPLFKDAYLDGALTLAPVHPDLAEQLLTKGMKLGLNGEWKLHFYAALIEKMRPNGDANKAMADLDAARNLPNPAPYVGTLWMHWRVEKMTDPQEAMDSWYEYLNGLPADSTFQRHMAVGEINDDAQKLITECDGELEHATDDKAREAILVRKNHAEQRIKDVSASPTTNPSAV